LTNHKWTPPPCNPNGNSHGRF